MRIQTIVVGLLLVASLAHADKAKTKKAPKPEPVVGRVVGLDVYADDDGKKWSVVTVLAGSDQGVKKGWSARFREGTTTKPLAGGEAILIRIDKRSMVLRTDLLPEQVRTNKYVEVTP
jgi:hypothetical protein